MGFTWIVGSGDEGGVPVPGRGWEVDGSSDLPGSAGSCPPFVDAGSSAGCLAGGTSGVVGAPGRLTPVEGGSVCVDVGRSCGGALDGRVGRVGVDGRAGGALDGRTGNVTPPFGIPILKPGKGPPPAIEPITSSAVSPPVGGGLGLAFTASWYLAWNSGMDSPGKRIEGRRSWAGAGVGLRRVRVPGGVADASARRAADALGCIRFHGVTGLLVLIDSVRWKLGPYCSSDKTRAGITWVIPAQGAAATRRAGSCRPAHCRSAH